MGPSGWSLDVLEFRTPQEPLVVASAFRPAAPEPAGRWLGPGFWRCYGPGWLWWWWWWWLGLLRAELQALPPQAMSWAAVKLSRHTG